MASKRRIRRKQCEGKIRHKSAGDAGLHYISIRGKIESGQRINIYKCSFCGFYHVGHPSKHGMKKRRRPPMKPKPKQFEQRERKTVVCEELLAEVRA